MSSALHNNDEDSLSSSNSSSSDSGDDYLTVRRGPSQQGRGDPTTGTPGSTTQREAMIRKKLLESFYGGTLGEGKEEDNRSLSEDEEDEEDDDDSTHPRSSNPKNAVDDMDTPHFNAVEHTQRHVWTTAVHPLLDIEESLACQVRTLDSRLQTLVYENYSRFIDATDAIRSIGVSVQQANEGNLSSLQGTMDKIQTTSRAVEAAVGPLRDQVVEKTRVHRLLQRLDTLLKLPSTLRQQIQGGKYRLATKSYVSAYSILSKHSTGFESLQRIETECHDIMTQLLRESSRKLYHWSGGFVPSLRQKDSEDMEEESAAGTASAEGEGVIPMLFEDNEDESPLPDPPGTIVEIMESAAAPVLVLQSRSTLLLRTGLTLDDCQDMALNACLRFLERILDMHHIELQEQSIMTKSTTTTTTTTSSGSSGGEDQASTLHLIPTTALDCILEVVTLYAMSFHSDQEEEEGPPAAAVSAPPNSDKLTQFVSSAFHLFLTHVRSELLEQAMLQQQHASQARAAAKKVIQTKTTTTTTSDDSKRPTPHDRRHRKTPSEHATSDEMMRLADVEAQAEAESDHYDEQIATSMATLLLSVRQLASGLTLVPHGAVPPEVASSLVEQTVGLTETMVRRRVDQKFYSLRLRVVEDCFSPFCQAMKELNEAEEEDDDQPPALLGSVQLASVALSDSLQLVDDTVRSILANLDEEKTANNEDHDDGAVMTTMDDSMLRDAVRHSTVRFAKWLASAMEVLAGYESSTDPTHTMVAPYVRMGQHHQSGNDDILRPYGDQKNSPSKNNKVVSDPVDDSSDRSVADATDEAVEDALWEMMANRDNATTQQQQNMVLLAIAEMCRVAERSVADQIRQSISTHGGGGTPGSTAGTTRKSSTGGTLLGDSLFTVDESQKTKRSTNDPVSKRFRLAASRILTLYAMNIGHEAANLLGSSLPDLLQPHTPVGPRSAVSLVLELFKATCQDCADLFGGPRRAGPIPESLEDEYTSLTFSRMNMMGSSSVGGGGGGGTHHKNSNSRSGLVFDVERMFAEKVVIYPHPNELILTVDTQQRNAVVTLMGKVAFQGWIERSRMVRFSLGGYRQIKMDVELMKWYLPHFVKEETLWDGSNALTSLTSLLTEVALTVRDRCIDRDRLRQEVEETNVARESIRRSLSSTSSSSSSRRSPTNSLTSPPSFCFSEDY